MIVCAGSKMYRNEKKDTATTYFILKNYELEINSIKRNLKKE
jgi:hypothetical protein